MIETSGNDKLRKDIVQVCIGYSYEPWLGNANWNGVAKVLDITPELARGQYRRLLDWLTNNGYTIEEYVAQVNELTSEFFPNVQEEKGNSSINKFDKFVESTGIDTEVYDVEQGSLWGSLYNMSASFKFSRKPLPTEEQAEKLIERLKNYVPKQIPFTKRELGKDRDYMAVISLYDIQLGRRGAFGHSGTEYTIEKYFDVLSQLIESAATYPLDHIVFVLGNDFADADNKFGATTKGTPQPQDLHWRYSIDKQCDVALETIDKLRTLAPVHVILVGGNHDMYSNYWLGKYIEAVYENADDVSVDNEKRYRKFHRYGNTSFMFTHGNEEKIVSLPAIFMKEGGAFYAEAPYNEVHMGHFHQRNDSWQVLTEEYGVYIRVLPSLSPSNDWEDMKAFILHNRAGIGHIYHKKRGQVAEFYGKI